MAKLGIYNHETMERLWRKRGNSACGTDTTLYVKGISSENLAFVKMAGMIWSLDGYWFFTERGLAYCREHFGKEAQNEQ